MPKRKREKLTTNSCEKEESILKKAKEIDLFKTFINYQLDEEKMLRLKLPKKSRETSRHSLKFLDNLVYMSGCHKLEFPIGTTILPEEAGWSRRLSENYMKVFAQSSNGDKEANLEFLSLISQYVDFAGLSSSPNYRLSYVGHFLNHVIKTRNTVLQNKKRLDEGSELSNSGLDTIRDQGFVRPCVLVLLPFRKDAFEIVELLERLIFGEDKPNVGNKKRFVEEFGDTGYKISGARVVDESFRETMKGNVDDCFRMGIAISKKELKLFAPFSKSDVILCSPLGLRMILNGDEGNESQFISSIQIIIIDKCEILLQQNWEHVLTVFKWLNVKPKQIETDIRRVHNIYLNGMAPFYCQSLIFSSYQHEQFTSLSMRYSLSHSGLVFHYPCLNGILDKVNVPICQELHRINVSNVEMSSEARFNYFKDKLLGKIEVHTLVFIPSFFDFVRIRNLLKRNTESFAQCHEYASEDKVSRARDLFYHGKQKILLLTERFHFFRRYHIRGAKNILFYQLPSEPKFYAEMVNMCKLDGARIKAILLFSEFDRLRLLNIFGKELCNKILKSQRQVQAIVSE